MAFGRLSSGLGRDTRPMGEINMTPLVDVMLVLLVIFIVGAPMLGAQWALDLPRAASTPDRAASAVPSPSLTLSISAEGALQLDGRVLDDDALVRRLANVAAQAPDTELRLRADQRLPYGRLAALIELIQRAGVARIAFVVEPPAGAASATR